MSIESFKTAEGLRELLWRLQFREADWHGLEMRALLEFTMEKYAALAAKYGYEPEEVASAAFEILVSRPELESDDPWGMLTRALHLTFIYRHRADGLLCSTDTARRGELASFHDPDRFCDHDPQWHTYLHALHVGVHTPANSDEQVPGKYAAPNGRPTSALQAREDAVNVFITLGWPPDVARSGVEYVCARLEQSGNRPRAHEYLRRDRFALSYLDVDQRHWLAMLRVLLGHLDPDRQNTNAGRGVLLLLVLGFTADDIVQMPEFENTLRPAARTLTTGAGHE